MEETIKGMIAIFDYIKFKLLCIKKPLETTFIMQITGWEGKWKYLYNYDTQMINIFIV